MLILDDDKPGFLSFTGENKSGKNNIKHVATEKECKITVYRSKGSDGKISCKYRTVEIPIHTGKMA